MSKFTFPELLLRFYLNWQAQQGKRASLQDFADYLGYSRPTISMWLNGTRAPGYEAVEHLAKTIGIEVYDALDLPRPDPLLQKINQVWERISPDKQQQLAQDAERYEAEASKNDRSKNASKQRKTASN